MYVLITLNFNLVYSLNKVNLDLYSISLRARAQKIQARFASINESMKLNNFKNNSVQFIKQDNSYIRIYQHNIIHLPEWVSKCD